MFCTSGRTFYKLIVKFNRSNEREIERVKHLLDEYRRHTLPIHDSEVLSNAANLQRQTSFYQDERARRYEGRLERVEEETSVKQSMTLRNEEESGLHRSSRDSEFAPERAGKLLLLFVIESVSSRKARGRITSYLEIHAKKDFHVLE